MLWTCSRPMEHRKKEDVSMGAIITHKHWLTDAALCNIYFIFCFVWVCFVCFFFLFLSSAAQRERVREMGWEKRDLWAGQRSPPSRRERLMMADQWRLLSFTIFHDRINRRETNQNASQLEIENTKWLLKNHLLTRASGGDRSETKQKWLNNTQ